MSSLEPIDVVALRKKYEMAGQSHVFRFWDGLSPQDQGQFLIQLSKLDVDRVNEVYKVAIESEKTMQKLAASDHKLEAPPSDSTVTVAAGSKEEAHYRDIGLKAISEGKVGVLLMAGGQGTRLGSSDPKGCYDIGLPSHKSLFQLQAERISRLQILAKEYGGKDASILWFIMTSGPTRKPTEQYFESKSYFGLKKENVIFFEQGILPCLTMEGKIMLDTTSSVATAPDGNGGLYTALRQPLTASSEDTVLSILSTRGVEFLHAYGVDNCLVRVGDPVFVGINVEQCKRDTSHQAGVKTVKKVSARESVGVVAKKDGKWNVIEYSEIPQSLSEATDESGQLLFRSANIVNHFYTTQFLKRDVPSFEAKIPFHIARKKIPTIDLETGKTIKPSSPNGMKLEMFIFDVFPFAEKLLVHEVERKAEFSPLKNASGTGVDDPETSKKDLLELQQNWLHAEGASVAEGVQVEISPMVSYAGEGLSAVKGKHYSQSINIESL